MQYRGTKAEKTEPVVYISPHLLTIAKPPHGKSVTTLQFSIRETDEWVSISQKQQEWNFKVPQYPKNNNKMLIHGLEKEKSVI